MSEIDPDREVEDLLRLAITAGAYIGSRIEAKLQEKPKVQKDFKQKYAGDWLRAGDIARQNCTSKDPIAKDLVQYEAMYRARGRHALKPGASKLEGFPGLKNAFHTTAGYVLLRRAYEAETGFSAVTGTRLRRDEIAIRSKDLKPYWKGEAQLLAGKNSVDSRPRQRAEAFIESSSRAADMPLKVKRKKAVQLSR
jgi:hypothetical protein